MGGNTKAKAKKANPKLKNYVNWFEIPVHDLNRAIGFYNQIYGFKMERMDVGNYAMAVFPADNGIGGALVVGPGCIPSIIGSLIYLNAGKDLAPILERVPAAGGRIVMEKTLIDEDSGYFALFIDSEGNRLALNSTN